MDVSGWSHVDGPLSRNMAIERTSQDDVSAFQPDTGTPLHDLRVITVREEPKEASYVFVLRHAHSSCRL